MTTTIFLHDAHTLRVSFPYSPAAVDAIKQVDGATWDRAAKVWRVPVSKLDALLRIFGDDCAVAPEVFLAASPALPVHNFAATCAAAGVHLRVDGPRVIGSGGAWTPVLQAAIDARAAALIRLLASGWQAPAAPQAPAPPPEPATLDRITHMDYVLATGETNARAEAARQEGYKAARLRKRYAGVDPVQASLREALR